MVMSSNESAIVTQHGKPAVAIIALDECELVIKQEKAFIKAVSQGLKDIQAGRKISLKSFARKHLR